MQKRIDELIATPEAKFEFTADKFKDAATTLPLSAATWASTYLLRATSARGDGLQALMMLVSLIANADVPEVVKPLLMDAKAIGLDKQSKVALFTEAATAKTDKDECTACIQTTATGKKIYPGCDECGYCRPPCLWASELPTDRISSGRDPKPEPTTGLVIPVRALASR